MQVQGPTSFAVLHALTDGAITEKMGYFHAEFFTIAGPEVYVSRTGWTGERGYEIYTRAGTDCPKLWGRLMAVGTPQGMQFGSIASMNIRRFEAGILDNGTEFDLSMPPREAGLGDFVDLDANDFIDRKAVMTMSRGRRLFGLTCERVPGYRQPFLDNGKAVGNLTAGASSPFLGFGIGYARMEDADDWVDSTLTIYDAEGTLMPCTITDRPFYDPEKRIHRGLYRAIP